MTFLTLGILIAFILIGFLGYYAGYGDGHRAGVDLEYRRNQSERKENESNS